MESVRQNARPRAPALVKTTNFSGPPAGFPLFFPAGISLPPMDAGGTFLPPAFRQRRLCLYPRIFCPAPPFSLPDRFPPGAASPGIWTSHLFRFLPLPDGEFLLPADPFFRRLFLCLFPRAFPVLSRRLSLPMAGSRSKIKRIPDVVSFCPFSLPGGRLCLIPKWFLPLPVRLTGLCFPPCAGVREPPAFFRPL